MSMNGFEYLCWYLRLLTIAKPIGVSDKYSTGVVRHIDFCGECTVVWVELKTKSKAFSYK